MLSMIKFQEALELFSKCPPLKKAVRRRTSDALHACLACDVYAPIPLPPFDNAAVDGFAVHSSSIQKANEENPLMLPISKIVAAKAHEPWDAPSLSTVQMMTGAPMPKNLDSVVMQEHVKLLSEAVQFQRPVMPWENVRLCGEDVQKGQLIAQAGTKVTPQLIGLLYGLGLCEIEILRSPSIAIVATGDELVEAPTALQFGQVYALTAHMLNALCEANGLGSAALFHAKDSLKETITALSQALNYDLVLLSGGISKGAYDYVLRACEQLEIDPLFYEGQWRPGKPLFFGRRGASYVFGLPGNPVASFVGFSVFVRAFLADVYGCLPRLQWKQGTLLSHFEKKKGQAFFARAFCDAEGKLLILPGQGSHQLFDLFRANALCHFPEETVLAKAQERVEYLSV